MEYLITVGTGPVAWIDDCPPKVVTYQIAERDFVVLNEILRAKNRKSKKEKPLELRQNSGAQHYTCSHLTEAQDLRKLSCKLLLADLNSNYLG